MSVPYVCLRCRHCIVFRSTQPRGTPLLGRRSFISLASTKQDGHGTPLLSAKERGKATDAEPQCVLPVRRPIDAARSTGSPENVNHMLEELFESTRREQPTLPVRSRFSNTLNPKRLVSFEGKRSTIDGITNPEGVLDAITTIENMVRQGLHTAEILRVMPNLLGSVSNTRSPRTLPELAALRRTPVFETILFGSIENCVTTESSAWAAQPSDVVQIYIACDIMRDEWWCSVLWHILAKALVSGLHGTAPSGTEEAKVQAKNALPLLDNVLDVWKVFCKTYGHVKSNFGTRSEAFTESRGWIGIPDPNTIGVQSATMKKDFSVHFGQLFSNRNGQTDTVSLAMAAAMTWFCIRSAEKLSIMRFPTAIEAQTFQGFVLKVMSCTVLNDLDFRRVATERLTRFEVSAPLLDCIYKEWDGLYLEAIKHSSKHSSVETASQSRSLALTEAHSFKKSYSWIASGSLRKAVRDHDKKSALDLWQRQLNSLAKGKKVDRTVFADFLITFFFVGSPDRATEVWNSMKQYGYTPARRHWLALLNGCGKSRDVASLQSVWLRMNTAKVELTNEAWSIYLSGLLACGKLRTAMKALEEMGQSWMSRKSSSALPTETDNKDNPESMSQMQDQLVPSIFPINTVLNGLTGSHKPELAHEVLRWATAFGIKPNTTTFNIFLRPAVRKDQKEQVQQILRDMSRHGCDPDVVTFTTLLDGLFRNPSSAFQTESPESQQAVIAHVFDDLEANGVHATSHTYNVILDSLLKPKQLNLPAVKGVLARMADQGLRPTPFTYTILITHYFSLDPPDLHAVDSLWRKIESEHLALDHVFYDRIIEGYGRFGAIEKMLAALRAMPRAGHTPGWLALLQVLRALVREKEWDLVKDLVTDVVNEKEGLLKLGTRGWKGEDEFWELVNDLRADGLELPDPRGVKRLDGSRGGA